MKQQTKVVNKNAKHNPVIHTYLPEPVTFQSLIADLSDFCTLEDLAVALNSLIQAAELSNHFVTNNRRSLQIVTIFFHDLLTSAYSSHTGALMRRLYEREWAKSMDLSTTELLSSLDQVIDEFTFSGANTTDQDLRELGIVREVRNRLILTHLGPSAMELTASLVA
jgi:hypothetical protein